METTQKLYTLLFVDDEESILNALKRVFRKEPYRILYARSGKEGLEKLASQQVDLVVSDQNMPKMTGNHFLHQVKEKWPETLRMMLTGQDFQEVASEAVTTGEVYRFITKPWNDSEIKDIVVLALQEREVGLIQEVPGKAKMGTKTFKVLEELQTKLIEQGVVTKDNLQRAIAIRRDSERSLGSLLCQLNYLTEEALINFLAMNLHIPKASLEKETLQASVVRSLPEKLARRYKIVVMEKGAKKTIIALSDPMDLAAIGDIRSYFSTEIEPRIATEFEIITTINRYYSDQTEADKKQPEETKDERPQVDPVAEISREATQDQNIIALVNDLIAQGIESSASDVHIRPEKNRMRVKYRIDGMLFDAKPQPKELHPSVVSRIKIMASMDISVKMLPQDGRIRIRSHGREIELRVSTYPTVYGESVVMRILDRSRALSDISALGFSKNDLNTFNAIINKSQGMFLVTGPTGSGKTTTLYSAINSLDSQRKNIITIEEPVEYELQNISQGEIIEKRGFNFASALRAILRHDPDIIFVGEIRDKETAQIAIRAAMTGHLVLSTVHANSAVATIARLNDLGVEPYLISSALEGVLSQRLVRKICENCKIQDRPSEDRLSLLGLQDDKDTLYYVGTGCQECNRTGYKGRLGVFEILRMNQNMKNMVNNIKPESEITSSAFASGMTSFLEDGIEKARKGLTSLEEIIRIL